MGTMNFKLVQTQAHKSLPAGLEWNNIPDFAIITGKNGTGKSHLLEAMIQIINWEGQPFSQQDIKYISAKHDFISANNLTSSQYSEQNKPKYTQLLNIFKNIQSDDVKEFIKLHNIDLLKTGIPSIKIMGANNIISQALNGIITSKSIFSSILKKTTHQRIEELTEEEFENNLPADYNNDFTNTLHLKQWFTLWIEDDNKKWGDAGRNKNHKIKEELESKTPPWVLMNEILEEHKFKYRIVDFNHNITPIEIKFTDGNTTVRIEDLSSGEQQIISLVAWAHHEIISENIKLLLLDEPDAHLHPSFCKIFIEIMDKYVVKKHKIKVIMTTHSPSTIAHAPEESIFVMNMPKDSHLTNRIEKQSKQEALRVLSDGLITLQETSSILNIISEDRDIIVFVEGESDVIHLENAFAKLNINEKIQFITGYGACKLALFLQGCPPRLFGDKKIIGLFDNDKEGEEKFESFNKEWKNVPNENYTIKINKCRKYFIAVGLYPLLEEHKLFETNTIELFYDMEILDSYNIIKKYEIKDINEILNSDSQLDKYAYDGLNELKYYKLNSLSDNKKIEFAKHCETLPIRNMEQLKKIFDLINYILTK